jgi:hypothetical protein
VSPTLCYICWYVTVEIQRLCGRIVSLLRQRSDDKMKLHFSFYFLFYIGFHNYLYTQNINSGLNSILSSNCSLFVYSNDYIFLGLIRSMTEAQSPISLFYFIS